MTKQSILNRAKLAAGAAPVALGMALVASPTAAFAQGADAASSNAPIIVTGTRISRPDLESVSPLTVVGAEEIAATGTTRAEDLINALPQVVAGQTSFISNGASGTATVNLRNLGSLRTLVLVDGRRMPAGDPFANAPDINQIPAALVERIEVVTGGASATYGADAVAGVVNFIMNRDFEGIQADAQVSFYQHNNHNQPIQDLLNRTGNNSPQGTPVDGFGYDFNVTMGAGFDDGRGHVTGYLGYREIDEIVQATRDYSACALALTANDPTGYTCAGSSTTPNGTFFVTGAGPGGLGFNGTPASGIFTLDQNGPGNTFRNSLAFSGTGADTYNYNPTNFFQRPDKRYTAGFFAEYEISPSVVPYTEFQYMDDRSDAQIAFSGTFFTTPGALSCGNPLLSDQQANSVGCIDTSAASQETFSVLIGKRMVEGAPRNNAVRHTSYRAVLGVRGEISSDWNYDAYLLRGNTIYSNVYQNDLSVTRMTAALNGCPGTGEPAGCVPLNVFQIGGVTPAQVNYISVPALQNADLETYVASGYVSGNVDNPLGTSTPLSIVLGAEYRKEVYELQVDENFAQGNLSGQGGPTSAIPRASFSVREVFAELRLPIVEFGNGGAVEVTGGYRLSDYNTSGTSHTYNVGLEIAPTDGIRFRGVYARAVRAPNVVELFSPQQVGLFAGNDPCATATPTATLAQCQNSGVTPAQYGNIPANPANQYNQIGGGNPGLDVEKADSYTVGLVVDGRALGLSGFTATVDYFNIELSGAIAGLGAQQTLNSCVATGNPVFCNLVVRNAGTGDLWLGSDNVDGFVINTQQNIGGAKTSGIDVQVGYRFPVWNGSLSANYAGTYYFNSETQTRPDLAFFDCIGYYGNVCGTPQPEYRHRVSLGYTADSGWGLTLRWRHFGGVDYDQTSTDPQLAGGGVGTVDDTINSFDWFDISASYDFTDNFRLTAGVNNVFDRNPPTIGAQNAGGFSNGNTYPGNYDPAGRYVYFGGRLQF
ncbi:MAG: TonB-dependent receptor [Sphingomonadaceae bacterium]|nr:TonB-dependent receptor [Sphingomonadaceae bacterium]